MCCRIFLHRYPFPANQAQIDQAPDDAVHWHICLGLTTIWIGALGWLAFKLWLWLV